MKNHTKLRKHRVVGMTEFHRFVEAMQAVIDFAANAKSLTIDGNNIMLKEAAEGDPNWGLRFGLQTLATLTEQRLPIDRAFQSAALAFTGEKPNTGETAQEFFDRMGATFLDTAKLNVMLASNKITFLGVGP